MPSLNDLLDDPDLNGVYRIDAAVPELPELVRLDARTCPDKAALLAALGWALDFPEYYGLNWDALEECLFDLSWWAGPALLLIEHTEALDAEALDTLADIWGEAAAAWAEAGRGCVLLLQGAGPPGLPVAE